MSDPISSASATEVGIGLIVAVWVLREILPWITKAKRDKEDSGSKDPAYWVEQFREIVRSETKDRFDALEERTKDNRDLIGKVLDRLEKLH